MRFPLLIKIKMLIKRKDILAILVEGAQWLIGRALGWRSNGCYFETHHRWSHNIAFLSKTLDPLLNTGSGNCSDMTENFDWDINHHIEFLALKLSDVAFILLINIKMPSGILTFMSRINIVFQLS